MRVRQLAPEDSLSKAEAAKRAGVTPRTINRWVSQGYLTKYVGQVNRVRISQRELDRFISGQRT